MGSVLGAREQREDIEARDEDRRAFALPLVGVGHKPAPASGKRGLNTLGSRVNLGQNHG